MLPNGFMAMLHACHLGLGAAPYEKAVADMISACRNCIAFGKEDGSLGHDWEVPDMPSDIQAFYAAMVLDGVSHADARSYCQSLNERMTQK